MSFLEGKVITNDKIYFIFHIKVQLEDVFDYDNEKNGSQSLLSSIIAEEESRESLVWPSSTTRDSLVTMRPVVVAWKHFY